ncbi:hypothetical protein NLG97_g3838 [Lecanicillium saksenae]|uniref:Uncharacterized protein n=1 Tax=Lecanicillium saksenae TaxID=468837 RepID=A0ACC1QZN1_9HYPO|nr:hypothetical protein NLG97_g3838 [Lecanicillium saksenae]
MHSQPFSPGSQRPVTRLLEACLAGDAAAVQITLTTEGSNANLEAELDNGWTALQAAMHYQHLDIVRLLIEHGAKLDVTGGPQGTSPLHIAVEDSNTQLAQLLLENNANPNKFAMWDAPLHIAVQSENYEMVQLLLDAGAVTESLNGDGKTPLIIAATQGIVAIAKQLLDRGANPNSSKAKFHSPLLAACQGDHLNVAALLLDSGASVDKADAEDLTPLFFAVRAENVDLARLLLRRGASASIRGVSIIDLPDLQIQNPEIIQMLQIQGPIQGPRITSSTAKPQSKERSALEFIMPPPEDDLHKQSACHGFDITMVDFYVSGGVEERLPVTASVHSVLYGDGPKTLLDAARDEARIRHEPDFTWYHIPANNMTWAEHLITRIKTEKNGAGGAERHMKLQRLEKSARSQLNFSRLRQRKGTAADDVFLKPSCSTNISMDEDVSEKAVVLVLPYLHFETFDSFESMSVVLKEAKAHVRTHQPNRVQFDPAEAQDDLTQLPAQTLFQQNSLPSLTSVIHGRREGHLPRLMSPSSIAEYGGADISRAWSTGQEPYMQQTHRQWEATSFKTYPPARLKSQNIAGTSEVKGPPPKALTPASEVVKSSPENTNVFFTNSLYRDLIMGYMGGKHVDDRGFQPRRTLDAYKYAHLGSIGERDADQVIYRYTTANNQEPKMFMVDQLWMWVLEDNTLVTCAPLRWDSVVKEIRLAAQPNPFEMWQMGLSAAEQGPLLRKANTRAPQHSRLITTKLPEFSPMLHKKYHQYKRTRGMQSGRAKRRGLAVNYDPMDIHQSILKRLKDLRRSPIVSVYELASLVASHCFDRAAFCLKEVHEAVASSTLCNITTEIESLIEIADIQDELEILKAVLEDQGSALNSLKKIRGQSDSIRSDGDKPQGLFASVNTSVHSSHLVRIDAMQRLAKKVEESFYRITDLKQKHASQLEAAAAAQQAKDTARQGNAIVLFTVVTIVFLPISFMAAFFAINIDELQVTANGKLPLAYVVKYMLAVGLSLSIPFILVAFNLDVVARWLGTIKRFTKPLVGRSLALVGVELTICGAILIAIWTSHLVTNIKITVTVVLGMALLLGLLAIGIRALMVIVDTTKATNTMAWQKTDVQARPAAGAPTCARAAPYVAVSYTVAVAELQRCCQKMPNNPSMKARKALTRAMLAPGRRSRIRALDLELSERPSSNQSGYVKGVKEEVSRQAAVKPIQVVYPQSEAIMGVLRLLQTNKDNISAKLAGHIDEIERITADVGGANPQACVRIGYVDDDGSDGICARRAYPAVGDSVRFRTHPKGLRMGEDKIDARLHPHESRISTQLLQESRTANLVKFAFLAKAKRWKGKWCAHQFGRTLACRYAKPPNSKHFKWGIKGKAFKATRASLRHVHRDGIVVIEDVVPYDALDSLNSKMVEDARTLQARGEDGPFNYNLGNLQQNAPPVAKYFSPSIFINPVATQVTSAVLGPSPKWTFCSANSAMPPLEGSSLQRQPVHADADFAHPDHPFALVVNVPLITMTPENGSTEIWLGTHNGDICMQEGAHGERASGRIRKDLLERRAEISAPMQPVIKKGSVVIRDLRLWHAGMPNKTEEVRVMLAMIHFAPWYRNPMRLRMGEDIKPILEDAAGEGKLGLQTPVDWIKTEDALHEYLNRGFGNSYDFNQSP